MAFVLTKVQAYGIESEEPVNKRYRQYLHLTITGLNTDLDLDIGDNVAGSLGVFWAAVDATATGLAGLAAIQDIVTRVESFDSVGGSFTLAHDRGAAASGTVYTQVAGADGVTPNLLFASGSAPTAYTVILKWMLEPQVGPVELYAAA